MDKNLEHYGLEVTAIKSRGRGIVSRTKFQVGDLVWKESPMVIGPKQSSELICCECHELLEDGNLSYCSKCGVTLCTKCQQKEIVANHRKECQVFQEEKKFFEISDVESARKLYCILTPLRLLMKYKPENVKLCDNYDQRRDTLLFCFNEANTVKPLMSFKEVKSSFTNEDVQRMCAVLDTNCYDLTFENIRARALYEIIALINHDCSPNCWKYFDCNHNMHIVAAKDIDIGDEITLSYTPLLMATPVRQVILQQTKHFVCKCQRCQDPTEMNTKLSALNCFKCKFGQVMPDDPTDLKSDYRCFHCQEVIDAKKAKMMLETSMNFLNHGLGNTQIPLEILDVITHIRRFLGEAHYLILDLKRRFISNVLDTQHDHREVDKAIKFCHDLLTILHLLSTGKCKIQGVISSQLEKLKLLNQKNCNSLQSKSELLIVEDR